ncbi:MAG: response regulator [Candidatus Anammoxibacter sp.]
MSKHVLVIDDEHVICEMYETVLKDMGCSVDTAHTGEDGIEAVKIKQPDLVFLDLEMPGIGGVETLRRIRGLNPDVPAYIVTAFSEKYMQRLQKVSEEGISFEICNKPLDIKQIKGIVNNILEIEVKEKPAIFLKLYIAGQLPTSNLAVENVKRIFGEELNRKYKLEIIDVLKEPGKAEKDNIIATPALVLVNPTQDRMIIGDLSDKEKILSGLGMS